MKLLRALSKLLVGPLHYGWREYDAERYWCDRHRRYGFHLRGSGNEALSEQQNAEQYQVDIGQFASLYVMAGGVLSPKSRVLDIGCGNGQYAAVCWNAGVKDYLGVDITDALFPGLHRRFPGYGFIKADCTTGPWTWQDNVKGEFDLMLMVDVIEHITEAKRLERAMTNTHDALALGGVLVVGPVFPRHRKRLFYFCDWMERDVIPGFRCCGRVPFKGGELLALARPETLK